MMYCIICDEYIQNDVFDLHQDLSHPLECGICGIRFSSKDVLDKHMLEVHRALEAYGGG